MQCLIISKVAFEFSQSRDKCSGRPTAGRKYRHCLLQCVKGTGYYKENDLTVKISKKPVPMQRLRILLMKRAGGALRFCVACPQGDEASGMKRRHRTMWKMCTFHQFSSRIFREFGIGKSYLSAERCHSSGLFRSDLDTSRRKVMHMAKRKTANCNERR